MGPDTARAARVAALGLRGRLDARGLAEIRAGLTDPAPAVRAAALGAIVRAGPLRVAAPAWSRAARDPDARVRRRAGDLAPALDTRRRQRDATLVDRLVTLLGDPDVTVVEAAAWALGEFPAARVRSAVPALASVARTHRDPLAREAAVAALGAIGDPAGLDAILTACRDKPAVRRRAVLALAPFTGPAVDAAIATAREDRDWQVRQAAQDLEAAGVHDPRDGSGISATSGP